MMDFFLFCFAFESRGFDLRLRIMIWVFIDIRRFIRTPHGTIVSTSMILVEIPFTRADLDDDGKAEEIRLAVIMQLQQTGYPGWIPAAITPDDGVYGGLL